MAPVILLCMVLLSAAMALGQVQTRAEAIEAARDRKSQTLEPDTPSALEQRL